MKREEFDQVFSLYSLTDILDAATSKQKVRKKLKTFSCSRNSDIEDFLYNKAIKFEELFRAKTYIFIDSDGDVTAYFSIAITILAAEHTSPSIMKILGAFRDDDIRDIPCFLIGQLGKSDKYKDQSIGRYILDDAIEIIDNIHAKIGGRLIVIDAVNNEKLIDFYKEAGFIPIESDPSLESVKMIRPYFDLNEGDLS